MDFGYAERKIPWYSKCLCLLGDIPDSDIPISIWKVVSQPIFAFIIL